MIHKPYEQQPDFNHVYSGLMLTMQAVGRIGYSDGKKSYITPETYAFDGKYIYGQTNEGLKFDVMRRNPFVCFEVNSMLNMANWESVFVWGYFEELEDEEAKGKGIFVQ